MTRSPRFSILTATWNTDPRFLERCVDSVRAQFHESWELCLADDGSTHPETRNLLQRLPGRDPRIRVSFGHEHQGISSAQNRALAMARGEFVALVDHDDLLAPHALASVVQLLLNEPEADIIYTDEDWVDTTDSRIFVLRKPAWSPEYLLGAAYFNHLTVYRRSLVDALGGFREDYALAQDWDLALRATAVTDRVHHIPHILYHWRRTPGSAGTDWAQATYWRRRCHADAVLARYGPAAVSQPVWMDGFFWTQRPIVGRPLVSIVIPTAGSRQRLHGTPTTLVLNCVKSLLARTEYPDFEVVIVIDPRTPGSVRQELAAIGSHRVRTIDAPGPFHYSQRVNLGARAANGDVLLLLNDDTEVLEPAWLTAMVELAQEPGVGVVGAKLRFPDGSIENCGIAVSESGVGLPSAAGLPYSPFRGYPGDHPGHIASLIVDREYAAVTGACQMIPAAVFAEAGGYDDRFRINFGDVDFCLRVRELGYRVVATPRAELMHYEAASRSRSSVGEEETWHERWTGYVDRYWHPEATLAQDYFLTTAVADAG